MLKKINLLTLCIVVLLVLKGDLAFCRSSKDSLLNILKIELKNNVYDHQHEKKVNNLKRTAKATSKLNYQEIYRIYSIILEEYKFYQFDSAYVYVQKIIDLSQKHKDEFKVKEGKIQLLQILTPSGMYKEGSELIAELDSETIPLELRAIYHGHKARFYESLAKYNNDQFYAAQYRAKATAQFSEMYSVSPPNKFEEIIGHSADTSSSARRLRPPNFYLHFITHNGLSDHKIAMVAMRLSYNYSGDDRIMFLALSAISDIRSSTKDTQAILKLGEELYKAGDLSMAYACINKAISDAEFYGARGHKIDIQNVLPLIAGKTILETERQRDKSIIYTLIFAFIVLIVLCVLFIVYVQLKKVKVSEQLINKKNDELASINMKLMEHTRINEEYIGFFFKRSFSYISMLEKLKRKIEHNIKTKRVNEALDIVTSIQISKEREYLYHTLDQIFLKLFPNFVPAFNELLKPEDQIWPQKEHSLNTVLRIFALIRLGIKDDETIAGILDYSVSTIYTYKIRIKSKAIVKGEEFDRRILGIKFINHQENKKT
ncbi:DUF6377 domain-containing protein [Pedobacter metabolipauper]|uniref:DUF6377 domain-containing protein n=1 Tax=Pedobacter metabolipauper TaxID=425513 RepID=A0A4R6SRW5_9SPHI|nr:DUF6377 domain-containing protein [Pedobacter metabolipauper]TDQ07140.1 hypothetical protein ATK78_4156 [Pedobacter metabolipauper]